MKKFAWFCVLSPLLIEIILGIWVTFNSSYEVQQNRHSYWRFTKTTEGNIKKFNAWGILSPIQVEKQKLVSATKTIQKRINFPVSPRFKLVNTSEKWENYVVSEIVRIADSAKRTIYVYHFDYDHTSKEVRDYSRPKELTVPGYGTYINLFGTASPESAKEGYEKSIYPGHFEKENGRLAKERVNNIALKLEAMGYTIGNKESLELQLSKEGYWRALKDHTVLNKLRYVDVEINILYTRLEVETMTLPVLLPLWILLGALTFGFLFLNDSSIKRFKRRTKRTSEREGSSAWQIWGCFTVVAIFLGILFLIKLLSIALGLLILAILVVAAAIFCCLLECCWRLLLAIWKFIKRLPILIRIWANNILYYMYIGIVMIILFLFIIFFYFLDWWLSLTRCQKVLFFLIPYSIGITILVLYLWFSCPCW